MAIAVEELLHEEAAVTEELGDVAARLHELEEEREHCSQGPRGLMGIFSRGRSADRRTLGEVNREISELREHKEELKARLEEIHESLDLTTRSWMQEIEDETYLHGRNAMRLLKKIPAIIEQIRADAPACIKCLGETRGVLAVSYDRNSKGWKAAGREAIRSAAAQVRKIDRKLLEAAYAVYCFRNSVAGAGYRCRFPLEVPEAIYESTIAELEKGDVMEAQKLTTQVIQRCEHLTRDVAEDFISQARWAIASLAEEENDYVRSTWKSLQESVIHPQGSAEQPEALEPSAAE